MTVKASTLVLMPTYNELGSLAKTVAALLTFSPQVALLIIDDSSPDGTGDLADQLAESDSRISVLHRSGKAGLGRAYLAGFAWGLERDFDTLVEMDADGSHRAEDLPKLLEARSYADLVIGSRWVRGGEVANWPWYRIAISRFGNRYAGLLLGSKISDLTAGYRAYSAGLLRQLPLEKIEAQGYGFQVELAWRSEKLGSVVKEIPITFVEREQGSSKMTLSIVFEALRLVTRWGFASRFGAKEIF